jgi:alpha-D-xyloside xylohydrolase
MKHQFQKISERITRVVYTKKEHFSSDSRLIENVAVKENSNCIESFESPFKLANVEFVETPVIRYSTEQEAPVIETIKTVDGDRSFIKNLKPTVVGTAYQVILSIKLHDNEAIYGLGQDEFGIYNKRGIKQYLYQHNMRFPIPFFISSRGYGVLIDCCSLMTFDDTQEITKITLDCVDQLDFYVITGTFDDIIAGYRELTGRATCLPVWALGYIQSKETYKTQDELVDIVKEYRARKVPLDIVVQDWKTWEGDLWGDKILDKTRFPSVGEAITEIHNMNAHTMISIWPNMKPGGKNHAEFAKKGLLLGDFSTYDAFLPEARTLYWEQIVAELGDFDSWWSDSTEPFSAPDWCGEVMLSEDERYELVGSEHKKYLGAKLANIYSLMHARGIFENQTKDFPEKPVLNLIRSGYAGIQKYGVVLWAGDTSATWEELRREIAKGLSVSLSGLPYWTVDIGAFFAGDVENWRKWKGDPDAAPVWFWAGEYRDGVRDLGYQELYTRWLQFGVFLPVFRSHGTDTPREIWNFNGMFYESIEKFIKLRYTLMPYIKKMSERVRDEHYTLMRSLMFDFSDDEQVKDISCEYMFGDDILVCPVLFPMYYEKNSRPIECLKKMVCYLPRGADWVDYWTNDFYTGGRTVTVNASIDVMPLFIRAGSRIPTQQDLQYAQQPGPVIMTEYI